MLNLFKIEWLKIKNLLGIISCIYYLLSAGLLFHCQQVYGSNICQGRL